MVVMISKNGSKKAKGELLCKGEVLGVQLRVSEWEDFKCSVQGM